MEALSFGIASGADTSPRIDLEEVKQAYADEQRYVEQRSVYERSEGPDAREVVFEAVVEAAPRALLEVGCGLGEFAARARATLSAAITAVDISPRMVEITRERGVVAHEADVQDLPFESGSFDCVVANWVLAYVPNVPRALASIARVLAEDGTFVAATNSERHMLELWERVLGSEGVESAFSLENGEALLRERFGSVTRRDVTGTVTFAGYEAVRDFVRRSISGEDLVDRLEPFDGELQVTRRAAIFIAGRPLPDAPI
jgi:SAM-dependent methyltransferase